MDSAQEINDMGTIIATNSLFLLKRVLGTNRNNEGYYVCFSCLSPSLTSLLAKHGIQSVIPNSLSRDRQEAILRDYIGAVGQLGEWNGHISLWWLTDIASKNAYTSPLLLPIRELTHCLDAMQAIKGTNRTLFLLYPSWPTVMALKHMAFRNRCKFSILSWPWSRITAKWLGKLKTWSGMFISAAVTLWEIKRTIKHFGHKAVSSVGEKKPIYLIKSFVYQDSFKDDGSYQDPFFGEVAEYLSRKLAGKAKVVTVALGFTLKQQCYKKMRFLKKSVAIPLESMLRYNDVVRGVCYLSWMLIAKPFKVKGVVEFLGHDITALLRELLASGGWRIPFFQYMHRAAGERLARNYRIVACTLTYEGNPWERAFMAGMRKINPNTRIIGYQHSVIPQAAANMFQSQREMSKIPAPDVVLTTGAVPANILRKYGAFPEERIKVSCGLRYNYLDEIQPQSRHRSGDHEKIRILVALCGVIETLPLVRYAIGQARSHQHVEFLIRAHPVLPFEKLQLLINDTNVLPANIRISRGSSVMEDILECDAVLYWGSSVALEGIRLGKPAIHFSQDDFLSYDPLFDLVDFKWVVNSQKDIMDVLNQIGNIPDKEFEELRDRAHCYVIAYHHPVSDSSMSPFLAFGD
jgi:hypothetical protein